MNPQEVRFCIQCGSALQVEERFGKLLPVCPACGWIFFSDPKVAAAVLIEKDKKVLLVRRAVDPQRGYWSLPAGFIDAGEDPMDAASRECLEETGLEVSIVALLDIIYGQEHPRGANFVIVYKGEIVSGTLQAGDDVDAVSFFARDQLPPLAFTTTRRVLSGEQ
jgi:ADP-ribose pyrophosphatase YjhB (NUDIX family)